jgi:hypothetical protein
VRIAGIAVTLVAPTLVVPTLVAVTLAVTLAAVPATAQRAISPPVRGLQLGITSEALATRLIGEAMHCTAGQAAQPQLRVRVCVPLASFSSPQQPLMVFIQDRLVLAEWYLPRTFTLGRGIAVLDAAWGARGGEVERARTQGIALSTWTATAYGPHALFLEEVWSMVGGERRLRVRLIDTRLAETLPR